MFVQDYHKPQCDNLDEFFDQLKYVYFQSGEERAGEWREEGRGKSAGYENESRREGARRGGINVWRRRKGGAGETGG